MISTERLRDKFYKGSQHPYRTYEKLVERVLRPGNVLMDAGCGRDAPVLRKFIGKAAALLGLDLEEASDDLGPITYIKGNILDIPLRRNTVHVVISRAVLEHVQNPEKAFFEISRVLKPGGHFIFLVPNLADYGSIGSLLIPNRFHPQIVSKTEGRAEQDVFPAYYKANTSSAIRRLAKGHGFIINHLFWLGQYPSYFMFNPPLFLIAVGYEKITSKYRWLKSLRGWILADLMKVR